MPAGFPVRGYEFYDGRVGARNVTFVNYQPTAGRPMSAIGFNRANAFAINTGNYAEEAQFVNANRVFLEAPASAKDGDRAAVFLDGDGSVTGVPGHYVAANNPILVTPNCGFRAEWNAWDCNHKFARVVVRGINGEVIGPASVTRDDGATARVQRDYDTSKSIPAAASLAELEGSMGDRFYLDSGAGMIHLKLMAKTGRDWAALFVVP